MDHYAREGYTLRDPRGEPFDDELAQLVQVDGWRHREEVVAEVVDETREPIVLFRGVPLLSGAVIVAGPDQ